MEFHLRQYEKYDIPRTDLYETRQHPTAICEDLL
jgi:hypothetical protein